VIVSPSVKLARVPLSVLGDFVKIGDRTRDGVPTVADVFGLSGPRQSP
jgi:hypothetical protein